MSFQRLQPGDRISHPMYGLGVVEGMTTLDQRRSGHGLLQCPPVPWRAC